MPKLVLSDRRNGVRVEITISAHENDYDTTSCSDIALDAMEGAMQRIDLMGEVEEEERDEGDLRRVISIQRVRPNSTSLGAS